MSKRTLSKTQSVRSHVAGNRMMEDLEGRQLMSVGPQDFGTVNTTTRNNQEHSANATNAAGSSVVTWVDTFSDGQNGRPFDVDIRAQRYNSQGAKVGPESHAERGDHVGLVFDAAAVSLFDQTSGRALDLRRGALRG